LYILAPFGAKIQYNVSWHMTKPLQIPLRFRFLRFETKWKCDTTPESLGEPIGKLVATARATELDGWACREQFFKLPQTKDAYVAFLNKVGLWFPPAVSRETAMAPNCDESHTYPAKDVLARLFMVGNVWAFRGALKQSLAFPDEFIEAYAHSEKGKTSKSFLSKFELDGSVPVAVIETTCFQELLIATVCADIIRGFKFQFCRRKDCRIPFAAETAHRRKFCSQYCGHLESVRKQRRNKKKKTVRR
jgi:hypothetical protein